MKKGYYLYVEKCGSSGVMNKIAMQTATFCKNFEFEAIQIKSSECNIVKKAYNMLPWASFAREYDETLDLMNNPDFVYIRRTYVERAYLKFLADIHRRWPNCKIIVEQPIYPYGKDMLNSAYTSIYYIKEILLKNHYKDNIDRFVTYSDDSEILGVTTIRTMNGVDVSSISPIISVKEYDPNNIKLLSVATLIPHHGYERLFQGIYEYYKNGGNRNIELRIVGDGPEKRKYCSIVKKLGIEKHVIFYGAMYGEDLDVMYEEADAGLSAFGAYKEGVDKLCTIKAREYIAKGLPVVLGCEDNLFLNDAKSYGLIFRNDPSSVDITKIIDFLDELYIKNGKEETVRKIRELAFNTVDNDVTLKPVIDYINN